MVHRMFNVLGAEKEELTDEFEGEGDEDEEDDFDDTSGDEDEW